LRKAIEILSPKNKRGDGRIGYLKKRQAILQSQTHLVEINLMRAHQPMPLVGISQLGDYRILVSDAAQRPNAKLYGFNLRDRSPLFSIASQKFLTPLLPCSPLSKPKTL
jgi:hypothetical protein